MAKKNTSGQLALDFSHSAAQRHRRAVRLAAAEEQPTLFAAWSPNIDIHLHSPAEAVANISGTDPERAHHWLGSLVGSPRIVRPRRVCIPTGTLDRLLWLRPPAQVTLDAAATAVARALWCHSVGLRPLRVTRQGRRLVAASVRWPSGMRVVDAPWTAIATLVHLGLPLDVDPDAESLFHRRLADAGTTVGRAALAGSSVLIETSRPEIVERMGLPALAYDGEPAAGRYRLPLLASQELLKQDLVEVPPSVATAIRAATGPVQPLQVPDDFPWTLFGFQSVDAGRAERILRTTGGVLLAGDMGSGKTTVSLALIAAMDLWPLLVVAPLSAFSTWERQLQQMGKTMYLAVDSPKKAWHEIQDGHYDAVVVSFDRVAALKEILEQVGFAAAIADEAQRIRTPGSRRSRALRALAANVPYRIALSGTPLVNGVADLLPVGAWVAPGEWKPRSSDKELSDIYPGEPVESIADHLGSMMVRRRMEDTGAVLPQRNDHRVYVQLTKEQRRALHDLEEEAKAAKEAGEFDSPQSRFHAFARLQAMRSIVNSPTQAGIAGPNPKVSAAIDLAQDLIALGRKGVIFTADRASFAELGRSLDAAGIGWVGIWGSTPARERVENERRFHQDPNIKVVLCTIQAGSESWSASPTATWLVCTSYMYAPAVMDQMAARVHRMNSDPNGPEIEIFFLHAQAPGGTLDDRMTEILAVKRQLFAQVVDRRDHIDATKVHYSMSDLMFLMTGERDAVREAAEADVRADQAEEVRRKEHSKRTLHRHKKANADLVADDGSTAQTWDDMYAEAEDWDTDGSETVEENSETLWDRDPEDLDPA